MNTEMENGTALISDQSGQMMFPDVIVGVSVLPVRTSQLQENEQDLTETDQALSEKCSVFLANLKKKTDPNGLSTRMLRECCRQIEGGDFLSIILAMEELGYDIEWYLFNSKYHGVPQNRERVYTVGHLRRYGRCKVFPISGTAGEDSADIKIAAHHKKYRRNTITFMPNGTTEALDTAGGENREHHVALPLAIQGHEASEKEISPCLNANDSRKVFGCAQPHSAVGLPMVIDPQGRTEKENKPSDIAPTLRAQTHGNQPCAVFGIDYNKGFKERDIANTLTARNVLNGVSTIKQDGTAVCIPVLTPDRVEKRQNGRRMKENGEEAFTLTSQDIHGVALGLNTENDGTSRTIKAQYSKNSAANFIRSDSLGATGVIEVRGGLQEHQKWNDCTTSPTLTEAMGMGGGQIPILKIKEATAKGFAEAEIGDSVNLSMPESKTRRGRVEKKQANTLDTSCEQGVVVPVIWYDKYKCYIAIRKLTPKECFRLQGWSDDYFERAEFVNSNSQLYKQAGNGVTVNVVYEIGKAIAECKRR